MLLATSGLSGHLEIIQIWFLISWVLAACKYVSPFSIMGSDRVKATWKTFKCPSSSGRLATFSLRGNKSTMHYFSLLTCRMCQAFILSFVLFSVCFRLFALGALHLSFKYRLKRTSFLVQPHVICT